MPSVEIAGIQVPRFHENPGWIPESKLVLTETTRRNLQKILFPLIQNEHLLLVGDAGVGKNALVYYINQLRRHPTIRYSFNEDTLPEDLVGAYRIDPRSHRFVWSDGPLAHAMRSGAVFVADEMNLCPPEVLKRFYSVFSERELQLLEGDASVVRAAPGFSFVATQNPAEGFEGRKNLPREIQKCFATVYVDAYPEEELVQILSGLFPGLGAAETSAIVRANAAVERAVLDRSAGARDLERYHFNIRNLSRLGARLNSSAAPELELHDVFLGTFRGPEDRQQARLAVMAGLGGLSHDQAKSRAETAIDLSAQMRLLLPPADRKGDEIEIAIMEEQRAIRIGRSTLSRSDFSADDIGARSFADAVAAAFRWLPPAAAVRPSLEAIARMIELGENALLECESDVEPEDYVHFFTELLDRPLAVITLSRGMHTADILGGLKPAPEAVREEEAVRWVDGPLTAAIRRGDFILLKGLEAAGPELVEKLNMLLDDARALALPPESGASEPLRLDSRARVFGLKFFRNQRSTPSISRAFRNRFTAIALPPVVDAASLRWIAAARLGVEEQGPASSLLQAMASFHLALRERAQQREIGAGNLQPYQFGLTNLRRWCDYLSNCVDQITDARTLQENAMRGAGIAYINELSDTVERERVARLLESLLSGASLEEALQAFQSGLKKKLIQQSDLSRKVWWNQEEHFRPPNTGTFKAKVQGDALKQGININTPETGGQTKEGADAWYGSDTQGNKGQGEPGQGGGAWGYRTEELYKEFLKKRRALWDYNIGVTLDEFREIFGPEISRVTLDFDRLLDPQVEITRRYMAQGSRVDARRYLAYIHGRGDGRVFDRSAVSVEDDKLRGVEILFAVNKGRRIFNFEYSIATLVAIMSCATILSNHELPFGVCGYSDLSNMKQSIDVMWYNGLNDAFSGGKEEDLFYGLARGWHGDTVSEFQIGEDLARNFSAGARTRILAIISDFRGARGKVTMEKDLSSPDTARLKEMVDQLGRRGIITLGVGLGARAIGHSIFPEYVHVGGETYAKLPALLAGRVTELIHRHHNAAVL